MPKTPLTTFACYSTNNDIRNASSSGGIFSLIAEEVLSEAGAVYGVAMTEDCYGAEFIRVGRKEQLEKLRCSKYLQARIGNAFTLVKQDLLEGKRVLFSGACCQINGLKSFLGKDYDTLLCVDVICHGVPSPALWRKYAEYQEKKNDGKLKSINFRCKDNSWTDFGMKKIIEKDGVKELYISKDVDPYMQMFLRDYCLRPSCYDCTSKKAKESDLTIGDFWGIDNVAPEMNDGKGTSVVFIRTEKGKREFEAISNLILKEVSYEDGVRYNNAEYKSCTKPPEREVFFNDMNTLTFDELNRKYILPSKISRMKRRAKNIIKRMFLKGKIRERERERERIHYELLFVFHIYL